MAFVSERIPEADKNKIDIDQLKSFKEISFDPALCTSWTIDRENDVFLLHLGGGSFERPEFYGLFVQGELVKFHADRTGHGNNKLGIVLSYNISNLRIPSGLESRTEEIKQFIRDALGAFGQYGDRTYVSSVSVEFIQRRG